MPKFAFIGDSLTQGFQSGAICNTEWSYPAIIARSFGEVPTKTRNEAPNHFRVPDFSGGNGLPLNLEAIVRSASFAGAQLNFLELIAAAAIVGNAAGASERYWETGDGSKASSSGPIHDNLAVWGFQVADSYQMTEAYSRRIIQGLVQGSDFGPMISAARDRTARRTLNPTFHPDLAERNSFELIEQMDNVENLFFWLGANNVLSVAFDLDLRWSQSADVHKLPHQRNCNIWTVEHFEALWREAERNLKRLHDNGPVQRVIVATVPDVTIPPVTRGVSPAALREQNRRLANRGGVSESEIIAQFQTDPETKERSHDGLYEYYTHFWILDKDFIRDPGKHPQLSLDEARQIQAVVRGYNEVIRDSAKRNGWHVVDLAAHLNNYAYRRNEKAIVEYPEGLRNALANHPTRMDEGKLQFDTRYLGKVITKDSKPQARGGFFSLDGVHPTTCGYGVIAHHILDDLKSIVPGADPAKIPWAEIVKNDQLVSNPPPILDDIVSFLGVADPILRNLFAVMSSHR